MFDGMAMYNILKAHSAQKTVYIDGLAASIASVIAMAGDLIIMPENSMMMIHNPWTMTTGDAEELRKSADLLDKIKEALLTAYRRSGKSDEEISAIMDAETWFTGAEAVEHGFADELSGVAELAAKFDLSKFGNVPESAAAVAAAVKPKKENDMPKENVNATDKVVIDEKEIRAKIEAENKVRIDGINALFDKFPQEQELAMKCIIDQSCSVEDAQAKLLASLGNKSQQLGGQPVAVEDTGAKASLKAMADVLAARCRVKTDKEVGENPFRGSTLLDMARASLEKRGFSTTGMDKMAIVANAFTHSTSDFPTLLDNTATKILLAAYDTFPETWRSIATVGQVSDFKVNNRIRLGSFNSLDTVLEGGEYKAGTFGEEYETIQAVTKGKIITMTRQMIINDDLAGFARMAQMLGRAAQRTIGNDVYSIITTNGAMQDGTALFHANHGNLAGAGAAISAATVGSGRSAMRLQTDINGNDYLNIQPSKLVVPVALEDTARVLMSSETDFSSSNSRKPNPVRNMAEVISDPRLDVNSTTAWYLFADPDMEPVIEVAFLDGQEMPYLETQEGFSVDGVKWKVRLDYGVDSIGFRGGYKNAGA